MRRRPRPIRPRATWILRSQPVAFTWCKAATAVARPMPRACCTLACGAPRLLTFASFAVFLIWHTIRIDFSSSLRVLLYASHLASALILAGISYGLCSTRPLAMRALWLEGIAFGVPIAFLLLLQYEREVRWANNFSVLPELALLALDHFYIRPVHSQHLATLGRRDRYDGRRTYWPWR